MEIKFKLFTTIAQALDKLKKQFDKNDKSLVKTQTTLDETIVNIDNVVDSVARTMTEALDPYFVDMIYGYIDDNGKFKLGVIKDPWKNININDANLSNIIPINTKYIYHWGDKDIFNNINKLWILLSGHKNFIGDIDVSLLFPNLAIKHDVTAVISRSKINKLIIKTSRLSPRYGYYFVGNTEINHLCIINDGIASNKVASFASDCKIHNLELIDMNILPDNLFSGCEFTFKSTQDIIGWDNIESIGISSLYSDNDKMLIEDVYIGPNITDFAFMVGHIKRLILEGRDKTLDCMRTSESMMEEFYIDSIENYMTHTGKSPLYKSSYTSDRFKPDNIKIYENNNELINLTIPDSISIITADKFFGFNVDKIILPNNLTEINFGAFLNRGSFKLKELYVPSMDSFINALFKEMNIKKYWLYYIKSNEITTDDPYGVIEDSQSSPNWSIIDKTTNIKIHEITIPNEITILGRCCFYKCDIETVNCNELITIGECAFAFSNLTTIICDNVITIEAMAFAFSNLKSLKVLNLNHLKLDIINKCHLNYIIISDKCTTVTSSYNVNSEGEIFCDKLYINSNTPPNLTTALDNIGKVYVPLTSIDTFKTANNWSTYADKIFPYDFELNPDNI